jgi:hypothetical protein
MEPDPNSLVPSNESGKDPDAKIQPKNGGGSNHYQNPQKANSEPIKNIIRFRRIDATTALP